MIVVSHDAAIVTSSVSVQGPGCVQLHGQQHGGRGRLDCEAVVLVQDLRLEVARGGEDRHGAVEPVAGQALGVGHEPRGAHQLGGEAHRDEVHRGGAPLAVGGVRGGEAVLEDVDVVGGAVLPHQRQSGPASDHQVVAGRARSAQMRRQPVEQASDVGGAELPIGRNRRPETGHVERRSTTEK